MSFSAKNSKYEFDMGYAGFGLLRQNICKVLDEDLYKVYSDFHMAILNSEEYNRKLNEICERKQLEVIFLIFFI